LSADSARHEPKASDSQVRKVIKFFSDATQVALAVAIDDDLVLVEDRLVAEAPVAGVGARPHQPKLAAAGEVVSGDDDFLAHPESDVNAFAIGGRSAGRVAVLAVEFLQRSGNDGLPPEQLAAGTISAQQDALAGVVHRRDREHAVAPHHRRRMAPAGKFALPYGTRRVPVGGKIPLETGAVTPRAAPSRPRFRPSLGKA
jgi:hypothetical protein